MGNSFRITRGELIRLFGEAQMLFHREVLAQMLLTFTHEEIHQQLERNEGPMADAIRERVATQGRLTSTVEVITALSLADFYFPHNESEISFEITRDVDPATIHTYETLVSSFETDTPIDCRIGDGNQTIAFQIKRYPYPHREYTADAFREWFENDVVRHYGNMNGTSLCILLQPSGTYEEGPLNLADITEVVQSLSEHITFDKVMLTYNERMQHFVLHELFPRPHRTLVPLEWGLARFRGEV